MIYTDHEAVHRPQQYQNVALILDILCISLVLIDKLAAAREGRRRSMVSDPYTRELCISYDNDVTAKFKG